MRALRKLGIRETQTGGEDMNKITIRLEQDLDPLLFKLSSLRSAKRKGDQETVNHYQVGQLNWQGIKYTKQEVKP